MNQQRSRRFRSAKEAEETAAQVMARDGILPEGKPFDSNCITPGTDFMLKLSYALQKWVAYKMETDPFWATGANVIVSGPDVPGEGEHKVMDFIREERAKYESVGGDVTKLNGEPIHYGEDWTHVLYGLDADLIMLGLVTHEPNFMLLREKMSVVMAGRGRSKGRKKKDMMEYDQNDFEVLELKSLRQLLSIQFRKFSSNGVLKVNYDLDRVIDDFVFMCMLVGNDFLPHSPHLEIDNGAISLMMTAYVDLLPEWGDYLSDKEKIHPLRFEQFLYHLAAYEEEHFKRRGMEEDEPGWRMTANAENEDEDFYGTFYGGKPTPEVARPANKKMSITSSHLTAASHNDVSDVYQSGDISRSYRDYYYASKLGWTRANKDTTLLNRRAHARDYLEGLHWVLNYYHNGCKSWDWFFPHLYSPLCTDMVNLNEFYQEDDPSNDNGFRALKFNLGEPFPSLAQLLSVLPPQSADLLPKPLGDLMLQPFSPLIEYYPADFKSDSNGKRQSWEAVVQIPFIESQVLLDQVNDILQKDHESDSALLSNAERLRNQRGKSHLFVAPDPGNMDRRAIEAPPTASRVRTSIRSQADAPRRQQGNPRRPKSKR
jgi:5'-3' exoribonuclease 1